MGGIINGYFPMYNCICFSHFPNMEIFHPYTTHIQFQPPLPLVDATCTSNHFLLDIPHIFRGTPLFRIC